MSRYWLGILPGNHRIDVLTVGGVNVPTIYGEMNRKVRGRRVEMSDEDVEKFKQAIINRIIRFDDRGRARVLSREDAGTPLPEDKPLADIVYLVKLEDEIPRDVLPKSLLAVGGNVLRGRIARDEVTIEKDGKKSVEIRERTIFS